MNRGGRRLPEAFLGFGADIRVGSRTFVGASLRMHVMGNFDYDPQRLQMGTWSSEPTPAEVFSASPSLAAQGQFYLRHAL